MDFMLQLEMYLIEVLVNIDVLSKCVVFFLFFPNGDAITVVGSVVYHFCGLNHIHAV